MKTNGKRYGRIFFSTLVISACTFGGGFVIVPLLRRRFVEELHWIDEREMTDMTVLAQSAPGAIAVNAAVLVGYRAGGWRGAALAALGTVLPPLTIISCLSLVYDAVRQSALAGRVMQGLMAGVAAVICDVALSMGIEWVKSRSWGSLGLCLAAFAALRLTGVNVALALLACGLLGAAFGGKRDAVS